jgi:hypothetical protein
MVETPRLVRLNRQQLRYLTEKFAPGGAERFGVSDEVSGSLRITEEERGRLISAVADRLAQYGFDSEYRITGEGRLLESIIDALTSGAADE